MEVISYVIEPLLMYFSIIQIYRLILYGYLIKRLVYVGFVAS